MPERVIQSAHGGVAGTPGVISPVAAVRFSMRDGAVVDEEWTLERPRTGSLFSYETWIRLWCPDAGVFTFTRLRLVRVGAASAVIERWGTRATYEPPVTTLRYATTLFQGAVTLDNGIVGPGQIGPWLVLQWEIPTPGPNGLVPLGPQPDVTYTLLIDEVE